MLYSGMRISLGPSGMHISLGVFGPHHITRALGNAHFTGVLAYGFGLVDLLVADSPICFHRLAGVHFLGAKRRPGKTH